MPTGFNVDTVFSKEIAALIHSGHRSLHEDRAAGGAVPCPSWAKNHGCDQYATPWADLVFGGWIQRMRWIAPGSFLMGRDPSDQTHSDDDREMPQHRVTFTKGFWLADTACSQDLWKSVLAYHFRERAWFDLPFISPVGPADHVSWDAVKGLFLPRLSDALGVAVALPTEAQWEYACRAGTQTPFYFGHQVTPEQVNCDGPSERPSVVLGRKANGWGLYQMHGNVKEWCRDGERPYLDQAEVDPVGSLVSAVRAVRGGSYRLPVTKSRSAARAYAIRTGVYPAIGFRFCIDSI